MFLEKRKKKNRRALIGIITESRGTERQILERGGEEKRKMDLYTSGGEV